MRIEILYPGLCNLYGDLANMRYLKQCLPHAEFIETDIHQVPRFLSEPMNLVYMGPMSERSQQRIIERFAPYKATLRRLIAQGMLFLFTGNALEVFGEYIEREDGVHFPCLSILDIWAKQNLKQRHNSPCLVSFMGQPLTGFKSQFTMCYPNKDIPPLFHVLRGVGMNWDSKEEGLRVNNFFGTYLLGPILIQNPSFTTYLLQLMGEPNAQLPFLDQLTAAHQKRLADFERNVSQDPPKYRHM